MPHATDFYVDDVPPAEKKRRARVAAVGDDTGAIAAEINSMMIADGRKHLLFGLPYLLAYFGCAAIILATDNLALEIVTALAMGNQLYLLFILHHDCVHFAACRSRRLNIVLGRIYALFLI